MNAFYDETGLSVPLTSKILSSRPKKRISVVPPEAVNCTLAVIVHRFSIALLLCLPCFSLRTASRTSSLEVLLARCAKCGKSLPQKEDL